MNNYYVFNCQFVAVQLSLGRECCLSGKEALTRVMSKDFQEVKWNFLSDPELNVHYHHEYVDTKQKDVFVMRVANKRVYIRAKDFIEDNTQIRFPYLYVIVDTRQETPTIMIEDYKEVPSSLEEVVAVLTYSMNMVMKSKGWKIKLTRKLGELRPVPFSLQPVMDPLMDKPRTIEELHGLDNMCELYKKKKNTVDLRHAIDEKYKKKANYILSILHQHVDDAKTPKDAIKPLKAFFVAKIMRKPSWSEFKSEFPHIVCSKSSYERLMSLTNDSYDDCQSFSILVETFLKISES